MEWRRVLNREYREMPFTYLEWLTDHGAIVMDLTENKDSYNEVLPNATNGVVNVELNLKVPLGQGDGAYGGNVAGAGDAENHQLLLIGEFRNEKKIGFNSPGRSLFDF